MAEQRQPFKKVSSKYKPQGLTILYEDHDILVVDKITGLLSVATDKEKEKTAYFILTNYVKKGNARSKKRLFIVHRIDKETSGVLIFAKSEWVQRYLQDNWKAFSKTYYTVVVGKLKKKEGVLKSYLTENSAFRVYSTDDPEKGKLSETGYKVARESDNYSLLEINLLSGRKNQIRVQLADIGHPVAGDKIYGMPDKSVRRLALHSASLTIAHPSTKEELTFQTKVPTYFRTLLKWH